MLSLTPTQPLLLAIQPADFRKGIDSFVALCRQQFQQDPFSGIVFVFTNKNRTAIKAFVFDGTGFWLCLKRFSAGKLKWWPTTPEDSHRIRPLNSSSCSVRVIPSRLDYPNPGDRSLPLFPTPVMPPCENTGFPKSSDNAMAAIFGFLNTSDLYSCRATR